MINVKKSQKINNKRIHAIVFQKIKLLQPKIVYHYRNLI